MGTVKRSYLQRYLHLCEFIIFGAMRHCAFIVFFLVSFVSFAQDTTKPADPPYYPYPKPFPEKDRALAVDSSGFFNPRLMQPTLGAGPAILTFFGDVRDAKSVPSISRIGYNLSVSEYLSRSVLLSARAMFGTLGANENSARNVNFESSIRSGGLQFSYNFDNFLPMKRRIDPFVLTGLEYFEYLSKTDLFDASGNQYHYWSDGSIMNMDETDPNVANAFSLTRDYKYETDIRKWNSTLFGKYPERSFAVPVGIGVNLHLAPRWNFKLGTTMHFTFTDYIDGVNEKNKGTGKGDSKKDNFLETYFTLTFDLFNPKPPYISPVTNEELLALMNADTDGDGVTDFKDSCQGTPPGVSVDTKGCPLDTDGDRFPDYADKEVNSPVGAWVDDNGVAMNDSQIAQKWRIWSDTTGRAYVDTIINPPAVYGDGTTKPRESTVVYRRELVILLGSYKEGVPPNEMEKLLSVPDIKNTQHPEGVTAYITGSYSKKADAEKRKEDLQAAGFSNAKIMVLNKDGSLTEFTDGMSGFEGGDAVKQPVVDLKGVVYRVQLGAYAKKLSSSVFKNAGNLIELKTEDGLYKYMSGSSTNIQDALKQRDDLLKKGYKGAFVVAYKDNKRIPLSAATGGIMQKNESLDEPKTPSSAIDKKLIFFRIQVGAFINDPPAEVMEKFSKVPGLEKRRKSSGVNQFLAGKFNSYQDAQNFKEEIAKKYGITDAFMVAFFKNEMITVQEAVELLK